MVLCDVRVQFCEEQEEAWTAFWATYMSAYILFGIWCACLSYSRLQNAMKARKFRVVDRISLDILLCIFGRAFHAIIILARLDFSSCRVVILILYHVPWLFGIDACIQSVAFLMRTGVSVLKLQVATPAVHILNIAQLAFCILDAIQVFVEGFMDDPDYVNPRVSYALWMTYVGMAATGNIVYGIKLHRMLANMPNDASTLITRIRLLYVAFGGGLIGYFAICLLGTVLYVDISISWVGNMLYANTLYFTVFAIFALVELTLNQSGKRGGSGVTSRYAGLRNTHMTTSPSAVKNITILSPLPEPKLAVHTVTVNNFVSDNAPSERLNETDTAVSSQ
eukprot:GILK01005907.1.p1 GENE.GILK01005907.1~~GILK01005907.1.p1  ORF type:complete len:336 (+),score=20.11 GILK01005907.1:60-1067(+)